jgi:hypothetical protein
MSTDGKALTEGQISTISPERIRQTSLGRLVLRGVTALALLVDAVVHIHLAPGYQLSAPSGIGAGNLFRIEAAVALAVALLVVLRPTRTSYAAAFLVGLSALGAVLLYRYVNVPAFGPLPAMHEPVWFFEKTLSAIAEAVAVMVAGAAVLSTPGVIVPRRNAHKH